jgi:hydroxypyruvate reductase
VREEVLGTGRAASDRWMDAIGRHYTLHRLTPDTGENALIEEVGGRVRALVSGGGYQVTERLLARLPHLGMIAVTGAGYDRLDVAAARRRGIQICNAASATNVCVADMAFGLYLAVARRIVANDRFVRRGGWLESRAPAMHRASGRTLGVWGLGGIGREVARRAEAFAMPVHYHNRRQQPDVPYRYHESLLDLASAVDILVCAVPATGETSGAIDATVLNALGPDGILVNVARGSVVDERAMIEALTRGTIAGAGLDVFADEPRVPSELIGLENVVLSPHTAGATVETWEDVIETVLANLDAFYRTGKVLTPIPG